MKINHIWATKETEYRPVKNKARLEIVRFCLHCGECASQKFVELDNKKRTAKTFEKRPWYWRRMSRA